MQTQQTKTLAEDLGFTVGICATGNARGLSSLLPRILGEDYAPPFVLARIVIVASACPEELILQIRSLGIFSDPRIILIEEQDRRGKADAINKIIQNSIGEYLVFVNSDAFPDKRSITQLLGMINLDDSIGMISGCPFFDSRRESLTSKVLELMWLVHNECSRRLNDRGTSNHCSDELMVVRAEALRFLPEGVVNDGAYMAGMAKRDGYMVKFCERSKVRIEVPSRLYDLIQQRRRIIFGHMQVWKLARAPPKTVESLLFYSPLTSIRTIIGVLRKRPGLVAAFPAGLVEEGIAFLLAVKDNVTSTKRHAVWKKFG